MLAFRMNCKPNFCIFLFVQIIRIQSPEHGTKRIETKGTEKVSDFLDKVKLKESLSVGVCIISFCYSLKRVWQFRLWGWNGLKLACTKHIKSVLLCSFEKSFWICLKGVTDFDHGVKHTLHKGCSNYSFVKFSIMSYNFKIITQSILCNNCYLFFRFKVSLISQTLDGSCSKTGIKQRKFERHEARVLHHTHWSKLKDRCIRIFL